MGEVISQSFESAHLKHLSLLRNDLDLIKRRFREKHLFVKLGNFEHGLQNQFYRAKSEDLFEDLKNRTLQERSNIHNATIKSLFSRGPKA